MTGARVSPAPRGRPHILGPAGYRTRGSHEFFTVKRRILRYPVEEKDFRAFALEAPWSTGLGLDAYLVGGEGDLNQIMDEEFQGTYRWWNNAEYRDLLRWRRSYNVKHPHDPVRFVGDDGGFAGAELYDRVSAYAATARPGLTPQLAELDRGLRRRQGLRLPSPAALAPFPGIAPRIARRGIETSGRLGRHRWVIERTMSWLAGCRRLHRRYERKPEHFLAFTAIATSLIHYRRLTG
ncbi:hypothetical protein GCM10010222_33840 [Streptomyces tanashiensis]|nr:hypothetical protein GCM10010222_33840 [Streptomyces tanashiensis]